MAIREKENASHPRRLSLRHAAISYRAGWWSVTVQVAKNKSLLGAVVGEQVVLNALGRAVEAAWRALPGKYPELEIFDFVVMPNHFHALLRIHWRATNRAHHLGFLMSRFKGGTSFAYGQMRRAGEIEDIGESLWQRDYWDDLVTSEAEFRGWQKYIRENPANWSSDRYGACTAHLRGNAELLNRPRVAFVASQGFYASALRPRKVWARAEAGRLKPPPSITMVGQTFSSSPRAAAPLPPAASLSERAALAAPSAAPRSVLISTFTSAQEREALRRALAKRRPLIAVFPAGIPGDGELVPGLAAAIREGWALAVSPQPPGSRLNKKIATWCNEFLLKNADEIWAGDLAPNGMLAQMLAGLGRLKPPASITMVGQASLSPLASITAGGRGSSFSPRASITTVGRGSSFSPRASITTVGRGSSFSPPAAAPLPPAASLSERAALAAPSTAPSTAPSPAPARRGQALIELAVGLFALALVVSALCGFALYIAKSLRLQNELRVGGQKTDSVEVSAFAAEHVFGDQKLKISEKLAWPQTTVVR